MSFLKRLFGGNNANHGNTHKTTAAEPDAPRGFGYKTAWYAVRASDSHAVATTMGLSNIHPSNWAHGIKAAYDASVFVTPPLGEWVLATGFCLGPKGIAFDQEPCLRLLERLSHRFESACYFATHRVVELHAWASSERGQLQRAYGSADDTFWDIGPPTPIELQLRSQLEDPLEWFPDEETVFDVAAAWSFDLRRIEEMSMPSSCGLLGAT